MVNRSILYFFCSFILFTSIVVQAQNRPTIAWDKTFGGDSDEDLRVIQQTSDGGYIAAGWSGSGISGNKTTPKLGVHNLWIVKLDGQGNKIWDKGGYTVDILNTLTQTADGGYIAGGVSTSNGPNYCVIKLDGNGIQVWSKIFGGSGFDELKAIKQTADGGYILGGFSSSPVSGHKSEPNRGNNTFDYWVIRIDANGNKLWDKTLGGNLEDRLSSIQQTSDGGFILGGYSLSPVSGDKSEPTIGGKDYWVIKLDSNGSKVWDKDFGSSNDDDLAALLQTPDGGYLLAGTSNSTINSQQSAPYADYWIIKLNANGHKLWDKTFGGNSYDFLQDLKPTTDGGYLLGGYSISGANGDKSEPSRGVNEDYWVLAINSAGIKVWDKTIGGTGLDRFASMQQTSDGGFVLGGYSFSDISGDKTQGNFGPPLTSDMWIVKLNAPCPNFSAKFTSECNVDSTIVKLEVTGMQNVSNMPAWTLSYTENGVSKSITDSVGIIILASRPKAGTVFNLVSITSGNCTTLLNQKFTMPAFPDFPAAENVSRCGPGSVTFLASGAPVGSKYVWFSELTGSNMLQTDSIGKFTTPEIQEPTLYYVALQNSLGCEGPRTQVLASLDYCPPVFLPNIVTQNNDGKNDTFKPQNLSAGKWTIQIYNRWGTRIYETDNYQNTWPETSIASGTYFYLLQNPENRQQFKGWVEVVK